MGHYKHSITLDKYVQETVFFKNMISLNLAPVDRYMYTMSCIFFYLLHLFLTTLLFG